MLSIEEYLGPSPEQWMMIIKGMRNPKNSWDRMDSETLFYGRDKPIFLMGENDYKLAMSLAMGGPVHGKFKRMIPVWVTITAPLYWWKEFDTYKVGTVANSCSTMHKIHSKEFTLDDFSYEHIHNISVLEHTIEELNRWRYFYNHYDEQDELFKEEFSKKDCWWQMIQLLPSSFNQKRTVMLNYEVLTNIYESREGHKLDEWRTFRDWILKLPKSDLITG